MLDKASLVVKIYVKVKMITKQVVFFYGLFLAPKLKYVLTMNEFGFIQQHMNFKGFIDSKKLLNRSQ